MMTKKIGILGSGIVGQTLGSGFASHNYQVMLGTRSPEKLEEWKINVGPNAQVGTFNEAAAYGDLLVLAVKGTAADKALQLAGKDNLEDKVVIDATNPIADAPPVNGVLQFFTARNNSLMEMLQEKYSQAHFVKAFSCIGSAYMVNPVFDSKPTMFICGNNEDAKDEVSKILKLFGWDVADMGETESARAIEPLCMLWCLPGFRENSWTHAFKLLKL
ncbi:MAG: NAD(P)-binding domain-containing protein [Saprospiraceae bacterium]|nr:NAD(P)-binding domain-containing protein [Saprospiraceae bacterium]